MQVLLIQTGGTIDKDYREGAGTYNFEIMDPAAQRILERIKPSFEYRILPLLQKDSQDISDEDRQLLLKTCQDAEEKYIVITHGTDTMVETGEFLNGVSDKVIVITGSSRPERFSKSDAPFNLGLAFGALTRLPDGIYVAMSGCVLPWNHIAKDPHTGQFIKH